MTWRFWRRAKTAAPPPDEPAIPRSLESCIERRASRRNDMHEQAYLAEAAGCDAENGVSVWGPIAVAEIVDRRRSKP